MKDAGGHGSVAHQSGVNAVGAKPVTPRGVPATGDGTFDRYGKTPTEGYMVGGALHSRYTGAWTDTSTGKRYVEQSTRVSSAPLARSLGRMRNQISAWDLARSREIKTGGTGVWTPR